MAQGLRNFCFLCYFLAVFQLSLGDPPLNVARPVTKKDKALFNKRQFLTRVHSSDPPVPNELGIPFAPKGIANHGGAVMQYGHKIYIVWYGTWTSREKNIIRSFINSLGPQNANSPGSVRGWWNINSLYYNASTGEYINPTITLAGEVNDVEMSQGSIMDRAAVIASFNTQISVGKFSADYTGIYLVLSDPSVQVCTFSTNLTHFTLLNDSGLVFLPDDWILYFKMWLAFQYLVCKHNFEICLDRKRRYTMSR